MLDSDGADPLGGDLNNFGEEDEDMEDEMISVEGGEPGAEGAPAEQVSLRQVNHRLKAIQDLIEKKKRTGKNKQMNALLSHGFINQLLIYSLINKQYIKETL